MLEVPYYAQETPDTCAPACLRMALAFRFPDKLIAEKSLAKACKTIKRLGTAVTDVIRAATRLGLLGEVLGDAGIQEQVEESLRRAAADDLPVLNFARVQVSMPPDLNSGEFKLRKRAVAAPYTSM